MVQDIIWKADSHSTCQKIYCFLYGTRRFITAFTKARHWTLSWASRIQISPSIPISLRSRWKQLTRILYRVALRSVILQMPCINHSSVSFSHNLRLHICSYSAVVTTHTIYFNVLWLAIWRIPRQSLSSVWQLRCLCRQATAELTVRSITSFVLVRFSQRNASPWKGYTRRLFMGFVWSWNKQRLFS
jgi:hypothetical protein